MVSKDTPIWQLTVGEFLDLQKEFLKPQTVIQQPEKKLVHGLEGIARLFGCSRTTASAIKKSGVIDEAITQVGRTIVVDVNLALRLAGKRKKK
jgi:hypothetical protein